MIGDTYLTLSFPRVVNSSRRRAFSWKNKVHIHIARKWKN